MQLVKLLVKDNEAYGLVALSKDGYRLFSVQILFCHRRTCRYVQDSALQVVGATRLPCCWMMELIYWGMELLLLNSDGICQELINR